MGIGRRLLLFGRVLAVKWGKDDIARQAASLAFFAVLSLAPLLLIATVIAGTLIERDTVREEVVSRAEELAGDDVAAAVETIIENASLPQAGILVTLVALIGFAFAGSNVFFQLQRALDEIWDVAVRPDLGWRTTVRDRLEAFLIVLAVGLLLIASPALRLLTNRLESGLNEAVPGVPWLWALLDLAITVGLFTLLIALIFKVVPSARTTWRSALGGALVTAVMFSLGAAAMAYYLQAGATTSLYGAAGSLMALLLWVYVSSQILLVGAEITQIYARLRHEPIEPRRHAIGAPEALDRKRKRVDELMGELGGAPGAGGEA